MMLDARWCFTTMTLVMMTRRCLYLFFVRSKVSRVVRQMIPFRAAPFFRCGVRLACVPNALTLAQLSNINRPHNKRHSHADKMSSVSVGGYALRVNRNKTHPQSRITGSGRGPAAPPRHSSGQAYTCYNAILNCMGRPVIMTFWCGFAAGRSLYAFSITAT